MCNKYLFDEMQHEMESGKITIAIHHAKQASHSPFDTEPCEVCGQTGYVAPGEVCVACGGCGWKRDLED